VVKSALAVSKLAFVDVKSPLAASRLACVLAKSFLVSVSCFSKSLTFARRSNKNLPSTFCAFEGASSAFAQSIEILLHQKIFCYSIFDIVYTYSKLYKIIIFRF